jgi:uncharacterized protein YcfJ
MMKRSLLAGAAAALALAIPGTAAAQGYDNGYESQNSACERQRSDDKLAGGVAGALIGGLIGGAIGNNIDSGDDYRRGHRRHRGHYRGYNRHRSSDNSDQVVVGALLGAVVGGLAGSEMAGSSSANCRSAGPTPYQPAGGYRGNTYNGGAYQGDSIPRTTDGLYGGPGVMQQPGYPYSSPPARTYPASSYPASGYPGPGYDDQGYYPDQGNYDAGYQANAAYSQQECRMIYQGGGHVPACRNSPTETWRVVDDRAQGEELYGY